MPLPNSDAWPFKIGPYPSLGSSAVRALYRFGEAEVKVWIVGVSDG